MLRFVLTLLTGLAPLAIGLLAAVGFERLLDLDNTAAVGAAVVLVAILLTVQNAVQRIRDQRAIRRSLVDIEAIAGNWGAAINALASRLATLEERFSASAAQDMRELRAAVERVSALAGRLSASVAGLESRIGPPEVAQRKVLVLHPKDGLRPGASDHQAAPPLPPETIVEAARKAIAARRTEIFLQPIVTLPQRRPRYYEALVRLRGPDDRLILPTDFLPAAAREGLLPRVDNLALFQAVKILRRISARQADIGVFCNIAPESLADGDNFGEFIGFAHANRGLADRLVFEMSQEAVDGLGPVELESLASLATMGFHFSMDAIGTPDADFEKLARMGFRFVKIPAAHVIDRARRSGSSGELADTLARSGIDLIADRIDTEQAVIDLLDCDVRLGQGYLFAPPRPVRHDALFAADSEPDVAAVV